VQPNKSCRLYASFVSSENVCLCRPDYRKLSFLKQQFPETPILALTATATSKVHAQSPL